ncbi:WSC domain-containing protein [Tricladium varicosporioides]|nr:WSC domain-containing protein [Hymenoscyphus varicosporioides]
MASLLPKMVMPRIFFTTLVFALVLSFLIENVASLGATDTITWGGDNSRTGYQTNHNMDPSVVASSQFGQLFKTALPGNYNGAAEQIYSQPLVYTTSDGIQYVYLATTQNNIYKINAKTGVIVTQRNLHIPFLTADLNGCVDINPTVGVTATGVIDPSTDTWYLTSKTYADQNGGNGAQGKPNGRYYVHAINVNDLTERPNFPVDLENTVARNNPSRSFNGGIHHQRPALLHSGQFIYAGFASHCVQYNFTGWIMGWDKATGATVERWATEGAGVPNTTPGAGVWMSGGGLTSDDAGSLFFASGNGYASQLSTIPVNGRNPPTSLEEAAVHMTINPDGSLTIVDFFMPFEKTQLDGADRDLGTTPLELLPSQFSCGDIKRIGVVTGKSGKTYFLNMDDLGGYQNGPNKQDKIVGVYQNENSVYSGAGVYPLEGGYIYINVIQYPTHVFKFSCSNGVPSFTKVADAPTKNSYILGTGHGTVTSLNGQAGTGLLWTSDVQGSNLRIYKAVPENDLLTQINQFNIPSVTKFTRPVFGNGICYIGTTQGALYAFGSPVNLPINCTSPYDFGVANLKTPTASVTLSCTASVGVTVNNITLTGDPNFNISGLPTIPLTLGAGAKFSLQALFNPQAVGPQSSDVLVGTQNNAAGYSTSTPVSLRGTGQSVNALLSISPVTLAFQGAIAGASMGGVNQSVIITNQGNSPLTISQIQYSIVSETGPFISPNTTSSGPRVSAFTFIGLPDTIPGNTGVTLTVNFDTSLPGNFAAYLKVTSNGGTKVFDVVGTAGSPPVALLEFQTINGTGWVKYQPGTNFTFGNVTENTTRSLKMRITNNGTSDGARLSLTVSKPPFGVAGIIGANNQVDLAEGTTLAPGENATATLYCSVPKSQWNVDPYAGTAVWTLNVDDPNFGKQYIQFDCMAVSEQAPPLRPNGLGYYRYTGCFKENNPGRQLKTQFYGNDNNTGAMCISACAAAGVTFCATQYNRECWGGPNIPIQRVDDVNCDYPCAGDINQICGGNGIAGNAGSYLSLFADSRYFDGNTSTAPPTGPFVNPGVGGYTSQGCYTEGTNGRALQQQITPTTRTIANCVTGCSAKGYIYAGMEYGGECWCGNSINNGAKSTAATDCSMTCSDNATEYCGAGSRLNLYQNGNLTVSSSSAPSSSTSGSAPTSTSSSISTTSSLTSTSSVPPTSTSSGSAPTQTGPQIKQIVSGTWAYQACWVEATTGRALSTKMYANDSMTLEICGVFCSGNTYFGVEYGRECWCGNTLSATSKNATNQADCNFLCPGDKTTYCGAGSRLQLYAAMSAATSSTSRSTLHPPTPISPSSTATLTNLSTILSSTSSNLLSDTSVTSTDSSIVSTTSSLLTGTSVTTVTSSSTSSTSTSAIPTGPAIVPSVGAYNYAGCYTEGTGVRALSGGFFPNDTNTIASCAASCLAFTYFGAEYGRECWCGNSFGTGVALVADGDCNMLCSGDRSAYCGAGNRLSVYVKNGTVNGGSSSSTSSTPSSAPSSTSLSFTSSSISSPSTSSGSSLISSTTTSTSTLASSSSSTIPSSSSATPSPTGPVVSTGNSNFTYYSCISEPSSGRLLPKQVLNNGTGMTIELCLSTCYNYQYAGVEYGRECWCGNSLNLATDVSNRTDSECSFLCPGNSTEYCGAGGRLSLYWFDNVKAAANSGNSPVTLPVNGTMI